MEGLENFRFATPYCNIKSTVKSDIITLPNMSLLFGDALFYLDEDVTQDVRKLLREGGGAMYFGKPNGNLASAVFIVNQNWAAAREKPYTVVFQDWVKKCVLQGVLVDTLPFLVSLPVTPFATTTTTTTTTTRGKRAPVYTKREDDEMKRFAFRELEDHPNMTQSELWQKAQEENLLLDRTAIGMEKHYSKLSRKGLAKVGIHFDEHEQQTLQAWAWCWENRPHPGLRSKWEVAEAENALFGRTAVQMKLRYSRLRKELLTISEKEKRDGVTKRDKLKAFNTNGKRAADSNQNAQWMSYFT